RTDRAGAGLPPRAPPPRPRPGQDAREPAIGALFRGFAAHAGLDVVAVGVQHEGPVVVSRALAEARRAEVRAAGVQGRPVEGVDHGLALGAEGEVILVDAGLRPLDPVGGPPGPDPQIGNRLLGALA